MRAPHSIISITVSNDTVTATVPFEGWCVSPAPSRACATMAAVCLWVLHGSLYNIIIQNVLNFFGGEVVTSRYFHRKAVLSTLDQLGKTKTHTQGNLQKTQYILVLVLILTTYQYY
jgi:hypothetical protein